MGFGSHNGDLHLVSSVSALPLVIVYRWQSRAGILTPSCHPPVIWNSLWIVISKEGIGALLSSYGENNLPCTSLERWSWWGGEERAGQFSAKKWTLPRLQSHPMVSTAILEKQRNQGAQGHGDLLSITHKKESKAESFAFSFFFKPRTILLH